MKLISIITAIIFFLFACKDRVITNSKKILTSPPYSLLTDSISKFPSNANLYRERAVLLSQNNELNLANADYKKSWEIKPDENTALEYVSNLLLINKVDEAIAFLKECIQKFPHNTEFNRRLSEVYVQTGRNQAALDQYNKILRTDSGNFEAWFEKGLLLTQMKDTNAAIKALEKSFAIQPVNYSGLALANLYAAIKNPKAIAVCNFLIQRDTAKVLTDALFIKGTYYSDKGQYAEALKQFDECIRRDWKMTDAYIEKGIILYEQKLYDEALKIFNMAATVSNTDADAYFWIARCYEATGKKQEAIENYERAISLDRHFPEAKDKLRRLEEKN